MYETIRTNTWRPSLYSTSLQNLFENDLSTGIDLFVFDTETTGLDEKSDRIIQFSALKLNIKKENVTVVERYNHYFNPGFPVPEKITELTGITQEMVDGKPNDEEAYKIVSEIFGKGPVVCAHNLPFDEKFVNELYKRHGDEFKPSERFDTLAIARNLFAKEEVGNHKLGTLASFLRIDQGISFHSAYDDTTVCGRLLIKFYRLYKARRAKEEKKPIPAKISFTYWKGRGTSTRFGRVYANTGLGSLYFDEEQATWIGVDVDLNGINMEAVHKEAMKQSSIVRDCYKERK